MPSSVTPVLALLRNTWRGLTSMRTALVLLFLLALAALPGALLPQRSLNKANVDHYFAQHPDLAPVLDKVGMFEVFSAPWFAAIYVLLFVSLIGCLVPRCLEYYRQLRGKPVRTPRNLSRMPHYVRATVDASPEEVMAAAEHRLRGWRKLQATESGDARSISAERGYLREAGNLVFHFALIGLLVGVVGGKLYGYEGNVIVMANGASFCNSGTYNYDSFRAGLRVDGTRLDPFCLRVNNFKVQYLPDGQANNYQANIDYQSGDDLASNTWRPYALQVNDPLRTAGDRVYLLGNGYAPQFTVTFPNGQTRTELVQWQPMSPQTMLSQGATKFDPPGVPDERDRRQNQLAITGLFAPTASMDGSLLSSQFPDLDDPAVAVDVLKGDLGLDSGHGQSIFGVDQSMVESGRLKRVARENLKLGQELRLADGTAIRFDGVQRWVDLQVSHDPFEMTVLCFAIAIIGGLGLSLTVKRRRIWVRVVPESDDSGEHDSKGEDAGPDQSDARPTRTVVEVGGLARTDQAGYGEEFTRLANDLLADGGARAGSTGAREAEAARGRNS